MIDLEKTDGFSLVEVLAAVFIMGIAVIALALSMESALDFRDRDRNRTILPLLARDKMESYMAGEERAEEGDFPEPWREIHWRLDRSTVSEGLTRWQLRLTRRNQRDKTMYVFSTVRLDKERP